jgi:DNA-binding SARP family transcriptional activator
LSIEAELVAEHLHWLTPDSLNVVSSEAAERPERWRPALRWVIQQPTIESRLLAARVLDRIGISQDVGLIRQFVKLTKPRGSDRELGRELARRLASRVFVEDQGRVRIRIGNQEVAGTLVRRKVLALLCFLLTRPDMSATRDQALEALWPDLEPEVALNSLNQTTYFLRRVFEAQYKEDLSANYVHNEADLIWLDRDLINSRSRTCADLMRGMPSSLEPEAVERLSVEYRSQFALDFSYEDWATGYRDNNHARFLEIMEDMIRSDLESGHLKRGLVLARRAVEAAPEADQLELFLLRLYRRTGAHAAAAEQYGHYAHVVRDELGLEPPRLDEIE